MHVYSRSVCLLQNLNNVQILSSPDAPQPTTIAKRAPLHPHCQATSLRPLTPVRLHSTMSGSAPKPYQRLVLAPRSVPTGATAPAAAAPAAAAPAAAAPAAAATVAATAAAPAARSGAAEPCELHGVGLHAQERKLDQRTQRLPPMNKAQKEEFKELESLLTSAIATAASEDASVVRMCAFVRVCLRACVCCVVNVWLHNRLRSCLACTVTKWRDASQASATGTARHVAVQDTAPEQLADARPPADAVIRDTTKMLRVSPWSHWACGACTNSTVSTSPAA